MNQIVIEDNISARSYNGDISTLSPVLRQYLTWGIVIATYNRGDVLLRCLRNALKQNRSLSEIVVVDASFDWEANRDAVHKLIHDHADNGNIRICYAKAEKLSSTTQRNQGIELATADVLFLIDDDSLMHPECAEEVMKLYEADTTKRVTGVMCCPTGSAPYETPQASAIQRYRTKENWLRSTIKKFLETDTTYFLPYDGDYPKHDDLSELEGLSFGVIHYMAGYAMTFRRDIFEKVRFCELLQRYAAGEDQDLSYRASRYGPILLAVNAPIYHLEISTARLPRRVTIAFADLNPAAMHVLYCSDLDRIARSWRRILYKRFLIRILKDIADRDIRFERARGSLISLKRIGMIYRQTPEELLETYGALQNEIIEKATR